jgi:hypothetical protein
LRNPRFHRGAVEGKQIAKGQKVTALVPRVENRIENAARIGSMQNLATFHPSISSQNACGAWVARPFIFPGGIDFMARVGYANKT